MCVFGSSSSVTPQAYIDAARDLGILLADGGHVCINGGGSGGVMGALNEVCVLFGFVPRSHDLKGLYSTRRSCDWVHSYDVGDRRPSVRAL